MSDLVARAARFAAQAHQGQSRRHGDPYIQHPFRVANLVMLFDGSTDHHVAAALLHDTIEDSNVTQKDLEMEFGPQVSNLVYNLTNVYTKTAYPQMNRKERKLAEFKRLSTTPVWAKKIKLADRLDNLLDIEIVKDRDFAELQARESRWLLEHLSGTDKQTESAINEVIVSLEQMLASMPA